MEGNTNIEKFQINCRSCLQKNQKHDALLYVNWIKKYYMISCLTCKIVEAFDEFGKKIEIGQIKEKLQVN